MIKFAQIKGSGTTLHNTTTCFLFGFAEIMKQKRGKRIWSRNFRSRPEAVQEYSERKRTEIENKIQIRWRKPQVFNLIIT